MSTPLANRTYRRLFAAHVSALMGAGLSTIALALLAYDLAGAGAGLVLGMVLALKMVTYVCIAPMAGSLALRVPRRRLLVALNLIRAGVILNLSFVTAQWQIYALIFLLSACSAIFTPTFQATIPDVLPDEAEYTRALSLARLAYDLENLLSPMLAAAALAFISYDGLFSANAAAFVVSALLVMSAGVPSRLAPERQPGWFENSISGIRTYLKTPRLCALLALSFAVAAAGAMIIVNTVVLVRDHLHGTDFCQDQDAEFFRRNAMEKGFGRMVVHRENDCPLPPQGFERLRDYPNLTTAMENAGWPSERILEPFKSIKRLFPTNPITTASASAAIGNCRLTRRRPPKSATAN